MAEVKFFKSPNNELPINPIPNSWYLLENGDFCETYVTDKNGVPKLVGNSLMIEQLITEATFTPSLMEWNDPLIGAINNSNVVFTTSFNFVAGKISVFINGLLQKIVVHYQTSGTSIIIFNDSPRIGDILTANYLKLL